MTKLTKQSTRLFKSILVLLGGLGLAAGAEAQYFGRTPVQWERFDFHILKTEHFDVYYYAEGKQAAEQAGRLAERWYSRLSRILDFQLPDRQALILYASSSQFQQGTLDFSNLAQLSNIQLSETEKRLAIERMLRSISIAASSAEEARTKTAKNSSARASTSRPPARCMQLRMTARTSASNAA